MPSPLPLWVSVAPRGFRLVGSVSQCYSLMPLKTIPFGSSSVPKVHPSRVKDLSGHVFVPSCRTTCLPEPALGNDVEAREEIAWAMLWAEEVVVDAAGTILLKNSSTPLGFFKLLLLWSWCR